jgi:creatinine amidohydrolase
MRLAEIRWPELAGLKNRIFVVPLGSLEQHGPHLPLFTDSLIISHIADRVEHLLSERIVVLPVQWLGHSPHHRQFGSVSLDVQPYISMIRGICSSLIGLGARKILLLNGHGGNDIPCKAAQRELKSEFEDLRDCISCMQLIGIWLRNNSQRSALLPREEWVTPAKWKLPFF